MIGDVMLLRVDRYNVMQECWNENPLHRPTFADIVHDLDRIVAMSSRDVSLTRFKLLRQCITLYSMTVFQEYIEVLPPLDSPLTSEAPSDSQYSSMSVSSASSRAESSTRLAETVV